MCACVEYEDADVREAALEALARLVVRDDQYAITEVSARPQPDNGRQAAVTVLAQIVETGDHHAIISVSAHLAHANADVRWTAFEVLAFHAERVTSMQSLK